MVPFFECQDLAKAEGRDTGGFEKALTTLRQGPSGTGCDEDAMSYTYRPTAQQENVSSNQVFR